MMAELVSAKEIHTVLEQYLHDRSDLGISKALTARIMEPGNPFEPQSIRRPQRWFVLFLFVTLALTGTFTYFNFWH
jgi:hypothetical protein